MITPLATTLSETKGNVERRFSLTSRERELELLDDNAGSAPAPADPSAQAPVEEEEEEERIYNPLKLPLGWDGKPIPYWLYKLHGLGVEYRCEICSDHVYMGRKNFDRHFQVSHSTQLFYPIYMSLPGIPPCVWNARSWFTEYEALPRDHQNSGCTRS